MRIAKLTVILTLFSLASVAAAKTLEYDGFLYHLGKHPKMSWDDAMAFCKGKGQSLQEQNRLLSVLLRKDEVNTPSGPYWAVTESQLDATRAWYSFTGKENGMFVSRSNTESKAKKLNVRCVSPVQP